MFTVCIRVYTLVSALRIRGGRVLSARAACVVLRLLDVRVLESVGAGPQIRAEAVTWRCGMLRVLPLLLVSVLAAGLGSGPPRHRGAELRDLARGKVEVSAGLGGGCGDTVGRRRR